MRHALYLAPPVTHPLWAAGCNWLGRDPMQPAPWPAPARPGVTSPWRYGFHATVVAPLRLRAGCTVDDLDEAVASLARRHAPTPLPALRVAPLGRFLALRPLTEPGAGHPLRRLADDAVRTLDPLRAPCSPEERARRGAGSLTARQRAQAELHGYPHVFDDWRLHFTLGDTVDPAAPQAHLEAMAVAARRHFADSLAVPWVVDALSLFVEPAPGAPFALRRQVALCGSTPDAAGAG